MGEGWAGADLIEARWSLNDIEFGKRNWSGGRKNIGKVDSKLLKGQWRAFYFVKFFFNDF
jgi:hypothetical protein